jgi:transcriptional regulator with XRE-family HTH domain
MLAFMNTIALRWSPERLGIFIKASKLRVIDLARRSGLPYPSVRDYVLGKCLPNVNAALLLAAALDTGLPELCEPIDWKSRASGMQRQEDEAAKRREAEAIRRKELRQLAALKAKWEPQGEPA